MRELAVQCRPLKALALAFLLSSTGQALAVDPGAPQFIYRLPVGSAPPVLDVPPPALPGGASTLVLSSPSVLAFGDVDLGTAGYSLAYSITNTGATATFALQEPADFRVDFISTGANGCGAVMTLPTGASCSFVVRFEPSELRSYDRAVVWSDTGAGAPGAPSSAAVLRVTGRGVTPALNLSAVEFGDILVGGSASRLATLSNQSSAAVTLSSPSVASSAGGEFAFVTNNCGTSLAAGSSCTIGVLFSPGATQSFEGNISISTSFGPLTARLSGRGVQGTSNPSPSAVAFGQLGPGSSEMRQIRLFNLGDAPVTYTRIGIMEGGSNFAQSNDCGTPVAPGGGSCLITVAFTPMGPGSRSATLAAEHNGAGAVTSVALTGEGTASANPFGVSPTDFGYANPGEQRINIMTIRNLTYGPMTLTAFTASSLTGPFLLVQGPNMDACSGRMLQPGASCQIAIEWAVTSYAPSSGSITVTTTSSVSQVVGLDGNAATLTPMPGGGGGGTGAGPVD